MTTITLDLNDPQRVLADLHAAIEATGNGNVSQRLRQLHDAIDRQAPKPRIPEPGKWGVVAARKSIGDTSYHFVNWGGTWVTSEGYAYSWDGLIDPVLIREGI